MSLSAAAEPTPPTAHPVLLAPQDPLGLPWPEFSAWVIGLGGAELHARRWYKAIHHQGLLDPALAGEMGRNLVLRLREAMQTSLATVTQTRQAPDGTTKLRLRLADDQYVESVLIPDRKRLTLCLSSQAGCAVGCSFCATGRKGLQRNLTTGEMVAQFQAARQEACRHLAGRNITNLVFMGMGEPLHNWPAVYNAVEIFHHPLGYGLGRLKMTISTSGVIPLMAQVVRQARTGLAFSLHHTQETPRTQLIPLNRRYPLTQVLAELRRLALEEGGVIMIQYMLLAGVNDSPTHAHQLAELVRDFPCVVNLAQYNPLEDSPLVRTETAQVGQFKAVLQAAGLKVYHRESRGLEIGGACGQLAG